ncbi:MAG: hypothetical protein K2X27_15270, partial [Candidatus Obscuribacterales bacterium]|nr:hypothetical protein [Candidatus Obscuribacterales bacterium]
MTGSGPKAKMRVDGKEGLMAFPEIISSTKTESAELVETSAPLALSLLQISEQKPLLSRSELINAEKQSTGSGLHNLAAVFGGLIPEIPAAISKQIKDDFKHESSATFLKLAESAALGFGSAVLLARSPVLAKTILAAGGLGGTYYILNGSARFAGDAYLANTAQEQNALINSGKLSIGKVGANLLETSPALLLGSAGGYSLSSRLGKLD